MPTQSPTFDMLPTILNLTQFEVGIRKVVKNALGLDAVVFPQSSDNEEKDQDRLGDAFGVLCFYKGRTKEDFLHILKKSSFARQIADISCGLRSLNAIKWNGFWGTRPLPFSKIDTK